jgi:hypothetical protein
MKKAIRGVAMACTALFIVGAPLSAQVMVSRPVRFGVMGGATVPVSDMSDISKTGWNAGVLVEAGVPLFPWGLRLDAAWNQLGEKDIGGATVKNRIIDGTLDATYSFGGLSTTKFYLIGGLGVYNMKTDVDVTSLNVPDDLLAQVNQSDGAAFARPIAPPSRQFVDFGDESNSQTKFGLNAGAGFRFQLTGFSTFVEARWHTIFTEGSNAQMVPITVGITF